jgi:calcineurin-like phosphoesterase family protein
MYWFTADEHYGHARIIKYCNRPFQNIDEMDAEIIKRHNYVVSKDDVTVHAGDFCWCNNVKDVNTKYLSKLNGNHVFLEGSHDHWLPASAHEIWSKTIDNQHIVVCHYAMRVWGRSHYNSWQLHGHSHGRLAPIGKQYDIGVDNNNFYPISFDMIREIMSMKPDNPNYTGG